MPPLPILIVDDEPLIRWSLRQKLEKMGYVVHEAATGREALQQIEEGISLAVIDLKLPDIDGLGLLKTIKREQPHCPVIIMTVYGGRTARAEAVGHGALRFFDKPFDYEEMTRTISEALTSARPA